MPPHVSLEVGKGVRGDGVTMKAKLQAVESQVKEASCWWRTGVGGQTGSLPVVFLSILAGKTHSDRPHLLDPDMIKACCFPPLRMLGQLPSALCASGTNRKGRSGNAGDCDLSLCSKPGDLRHRSSHL